MFVVTWPRQDLWFKKDTPLFLRDFDENRNITYTSFTRGSYHWQNVIFWNFHGRDNRVLPPAAYSAIRLNVPGKQHGFYPCNPTRNNGFNRRLFFGGRCNETQAENNTPLFNALPATTSKIATAPKEQTNTTTKAAPAATSAPRSAVGLTTSFRQLLSLGQGRRVARKVVVLPEPLAQVTVRRRFCALVVWRKNAGVFLHIF